jgi:arylsulfatase A-like enzyme
MTTRRTFLKTVGLGAAALALPGCAAAAKNITRNTTMKKKPNILFICTDYQAHVDIPRESTFLDMPGVDRLCREGAVFNKHYSSAPICMPARYTWITGQYPHTHGEYDNRGKWIPDDSPVLMKELKKAGYYTVGVGKMHFHPITRMAGFDRRIIADQKEAGWLDDDFARYLKAHGINKNRIYKKQDPDEFPRIYDYPEDEKLHIDYYVGDQALQIIEKNELDDKDPWFMWVSFNGPHSPWDPPAKYAEPYRKMKLPKCNYQFGELETKPANHTIERYIYSRGIMDYVDQHPEKREPLFHAMRAAHYGNLTFIDRQIEKILNALEKKNELDSTIVIFSADHGACLGDHDMIHKATHLERSAHVPFIVRYPSRVKPKEINGFSGHVDMLPTILSMVSAPIPDNVEGTDLSPMLLGTKDSVQGEVFIEIRNDTSIITDEYKMSVPKGPWFASKRPVMDGDLYDRKKDPMEQVNQINNPAYTAVRDALLVRILAFNPALNGTVQVPVVPLPPEPTTFNLDQGEVLGLRTDREPPNQREKEITFSVKIIPPAHGKPEGVILLSNVYPHGYTLVIQDGRLVMAVRRWNKDTSVAADTPVPDGPFTVQARLAQDGTVTLGINGKNVAEGKTPGCVPEQPGRDIRFTAGEIRLGSAGRRGALIDETNRDSEFSGTLSDAVLKLKG